MPRQADISTVEKAFILQALLKDLRLDGRRVDQFRTVELEFGSQYGTVTITLGKTRCVGSRYYLPRSARLIFHCRVYVQVSAEVAQPNEDRKFDGIFTITAELSPMASPAFEVGRPTEHEVILSRMLEKAIRRSRAIDTESLCIVAGRKCWSVRADVHILEADGGLVDASCIAIMAGLQHFRRPDVSVDGDVVTVHTMEERVPVPLSILHNPICTTFNLYLAGEAVLVDATQKEEQVSDAEMVITTNDFELCQIAKLGGQSVRSDTVLRCVTIALANARQMNAMIKKKLAEDATRRDVGGLIAELRAENER